MVGLGKQVCVIALTVLAAAAVFAQTAPKSIAPVTLQNASMRGLVEYTFAGTGASSGDSIRLTVQETPKAAGRSLTITLPPGSLLHNSNASSQNMVVSVIRGVDLGGGLIRPASQIYIHGTSPVKVVVSAFCAEFEKNNPSAGTTFTLEQPDSMLACIVRQGRDLSIQAQQAAVWIYTDSITYEHMRTKFPIGPGDWTTARGLVDHCNSMAR